MKVLVISTANTMVLAFNGKSWIDKTSNVKLSHPWPDVFKRLHFVIN